MALIVLVTRGRQLPTGREVAGRTSRRATVGEDTRLPDNVLERIRAAGDGGHRHRSRNRPTRRPGGDMEPIQETTPPPEESVDSAKCPGGGTVDRR